MINKIRENKNLLLIIVIVALALLSFWMYRYYSQDFGIERVAAEPEEGFSVDYFYYTAEDLAGQSEAPLIVHPFHAGVDGEIEQNEAAEKAYAAARSLHTLAREMEAAIIVPAFSLADTAGEDEGSVSIEERYQRTGAELQAIIDHFRKRMQGRDINIQEEVNLFGFGYSALYASRWQLMYPDSVRTAVLGAPGEWPAVPVEAERGISFEFPLGLEGLDNNQMRKEALRENAIFHFRGEEDDYSLLADSRVYSSDHQQTLADLFENEDNYLETVKQFFARNSLEYTYRTYEDVDHRFNLEMHDDVLEFMREFN